MRDADMSPRAASALFAEALAHLDVIQPAAAREPIREMLRAGIELCVSSRSLLGKPVMYTVALARAVVGYECDLDVDDLPAG